MCLTSLRLQYQDCLRPQVCFYNAHQLCQKVVLHLFLLSFWFYIQADTTSFTETRVFSPCNFHKLFEIHKLLILSALQDYSSLLLLCKAVVCVVWHCKMPSFILQKAAFAPVFGLFWNNQLPCFISYSTILPSGRQYELW